MASGRQAEGCVTCACVFCTCEPLPYDAASRVLVLVVVVVGYLSHRRRFEWVVRHEYHVVVMVVAVRWGCCVHSHSGSSSSSASRITNKGYVSHTRDTRPSSLCVLTPASDAAAAAAMYIIHFRTFRFGETLSFSCVFFGASASRTSEAFLFCD